MAVGSTGLSLDEARAWRAALFAVQTGKRVVDLRTGLRPHPRMAAYEAAFGPLSSLHQHLILPAVTARRRDRLRALVPGWGRA